MAGVCFGCTHPPCALIFAAPGSEHCAWRGRSGCALWHRTATTPHMLRHLRQQGGEPLPLPQRAQQRGGSLRLPALQRQQQQAGHLCCSSAPPCRAGTCASLPGAERSLAGRPPGGWASDSHGGARRRRRRRPALAGRPLPGWLSLPRSHAPCAWPLNSPLPRERGCDTTAGWPVGSRRFLASGKSPLPASQHRWLGTLPSVEWPAFSTSRPLGTLRE